MRLIGLWTLVVIGLWNGPALSSETDCLRNFFSDLPVDCSDDAQAGNGEKLLLLYSKPAQVHPDPGQAVIWEMESENAVLSEGGPTAPARFSLICHAPSGPHLSLQFPGYPLFVTNERLRIAMVHVDEVLYTFEATRGDSMFDAVLRETKALRAMGDLIAGIGGSTVVFSSRDQDGLQVRASFSKDELGRRLGENLRHCRL